MHYLPGREKEVFVNTEAKQESATVQYCLAGG
jgi:hypothetical protein